jgi:dienelactone hydrolase
MLARKIAAVLTLPLASATAAQEATRHRADFPAVAPASSWDDVLTGVKSKQDWLSHRERLRKRFLNLIRDQHKPEKPPLDVRIHETEVVDGRYERKLISYQVEAGERAFAFLGIPLKLKGPRPGIVALHGTYEKGIEQLAGLEGNPDKAFFDHLCRRGYVVIAPEHFVSGRRTPRAGAYDTAQFYERHPQWTAVGKFTYEHSIAVDVLTGLKEVDADRIGVIGHSLGGHGAIFLAAYDDRVKAAACNCGAAFFRHNDRADSWARDHWYVYFKPLRGALHRGELPDIDFHEIIALVAPRAFLDISALNDGDPNTQRQRVLMLSSVMRVYELLGAADRFSFFVHGRGHSAPRESRELMYAWLDAQLKQPVSKHAPVQNSSKPPQTTDAETAAVSH